MQSSTNLASSSQTSLPLHSSSTPVHRGNLTKAFGYKGGQGFLERADVKLLSDQLKNETACDDCSVRGLLEDQRNLLQSLQLQQGGGSELEGEGRRRGREGSLRELTRRASEEDEMIKSDQNSARKRRDSVSKAQQKGLGSPFSGSAGASVVGGAGGGGGGPNIMTAKKYPPVTNSAGAGSKPLRRGTGRSRSSSADSTQSLSKDVMLNELAQALKNERKKCEEYEAEILAIEEEVSGVLSDSLARPKLTPLAESRTTRSLLLPM